MLKTSLKMATFTCTLILISISLVCGGNYGEASSVDDRPTVENSHKENEFSKRSAKKPFCVFSQEAKDSKFIDFLNEVSLT